MTRVNQVDSCYIQFVLPADPVPYHLLPFTADSNIKLFWTSTIYLLNQATKLAITTRIGDGGRVVVVNILAPELFLILAQPVYKMWIIQEPNMLELWNKLHFEEKKTGEYIN